MTHHFVNLVSWRYFALDMRPYRKIYVDSLTMKVMIRLFGRNTDRLSGVGYFAGANFPCETIFLTSSTYKAQYFYVLPFWNTKAEIVLSSKLRSAILDYSTIVIGISSPKQDYLADLIKSQFPDKEVFCLGAAIYENNTEERIDDLGLNWLIMMLKNPKRFVYKISLTFSSAVKIVFLKKERLLFRRFIETII